MIVERRNDDANDQFPVGMRVLAVDDDPICLRLLETLLRKCQYHVTTKDRAIDALKLLRENRDKFDLVISDVHMPDMDGFKLLELVGLEMDLPVIMLSANGDTKLVMKGISHGACDYLLKPIRLEELKNIWQHVIRRKKFEKKDQNNSDNREKRSCPVGEGQKSSKTDDSDEDGRGSKRRKDQNEEDDEDTDENEDPSSQKKGRVVWSVELHRKFVAAVNQLGFERAVPKKILELMNVEKLTRENVASHLQKYRLYLKRLSSVANQQANMVAALGGPDSAYLRMNAMNFHGFNGSGPFQNNSLRSLPPAGVLGRLNSPASLGIHGLSPSGMAALGHGQMTRNPIADSSKFPLPRDQTGNILQGMPTSLGFDQLQIPHKKDLMGAGDFSSTNGGTGLFSMSSGALDVNNVVNGQGNNTFHTLPSSSMLQQGHSQEIEGHGAIGHHFSAFSLTDPNRCNANWPSVGQSYGVQSSSFASNDGYPSNPTPPVTQAFISSSRVRSTVLNGASESHISSNISGFDTIYEKVVLGNNRAENSGHISKPLWDNHKLDIVHHPDLTHSSMNPPLVTPSACSSTSVGDPTGMFFGGSSEFGVIGLSSMDSSTAGISGMESTVNMGGFSVNGAGSLEDVVTSMVKRDPDGVTPRKDTDLGVYSLRTCI